MMIVIETWDEFARALDSPLDPKLHLCLYGHRDRLSEWQDIDLSDLAILLIVQAGDRLELAEAAVGRTLVNHSHFAFLPEFIERHGAWLEAAFVLSDDGYGLVLLAEEGPGADYRLLQAFRNAAAGNDSIAHR